MSVQLPPEVSENSVDSSIANSVEIPILDSADSSMEDPSEYSIKASVGGTMENSDGDSIKTLADSSMEDLADNSVENAAGNLIQDAASENPIDETAVEQMFWLKNQTMEHLLTSFQWYTFTLARHGTDSISLTNVIVMGLIFQRVQNRLSAARDFAEAAEAVQETTNFIDVLCLIIRNNFTNLGEQVDILRNRNRRRP